MTAGVETMLWMAPEVMRGDCYGDKADVFSVDVVLSELDVHTLPYSTAKSKVEAEGVGKSGIWRCCTRSRWAI